MVIEDAFARNGSHTGDLSQAASIRISCLTQFDAAWRDARQVLVWKKLIHPYGFFSVLSNCSVGSSSSTTKSGIFKMIYYLWLNYISRYIIRNNKKEWFLDYFRYLLVRLTFASIYNNSAFMTREPCILQSRCEGNFPFLVVLALMVVSCGYHLKWEYIYHHHGHCRHCLNLNLNLVSYGVLPQRR